MKADPKYSAGAREERRAFRAYLTRQMKKTITIQTANNYRLAVSYALNFVKARQQRYDKKPGGLGR